MPVEIDDELLDRIARHFRPRGRWGERVRGERPGGRWDYLSSVKLCTMLVRALSAFSPEMASVLSWYSQSGVTR